MIQGRDCLLPALDCFVFRSRVRGTSEWEGHQNFAFVCPNKANVGIQDLSLSVQKEPMTTISCNVHEFFSVFPGSQRTKEAVPRENSKA